ncbi:MAG: GNAT family N-acetyltransferase [Nocardioidaceae bacterium]
MLVCGDPPTGFAAVTEADGQAHLEQVSVHPRHAGRGLGADLVRAALRRASSLGYTRMTLMTYADVPWNGPYYRRLGFEALSAPGPDLMRMREHESSLGLDRHGTRVAMCRHLQDPASEC